jgi:flagellar hook-basal body complex protein FliE
LAIQPIQPLTSLSATLPAASVGGSSASSGTSFATILGQALDSVSGSVANSQIQGVSLAEGNASNLASVMVSGSQAQLAVDMVVQVRNRVIDTYNQVMSMSV